MGPSLGQINRRAVEAAVNEMGVPRVADPDGPSNIGWVAGFVIILGVLAVGAALWFTHHPF